MALKSKRFKVEHDKFPLMQEVFQDNVRYCNGKVIRIDTESSIIEIPPSGNPSMRKEALNLYIKRWESCGFKLTKQ